MSFKPTLSSLFESATMPTTKKDITKQQIKSFIDSKSNSNAKESVFDAKGSLTDLELKLQYVSKRKSQLLLLDVKENVRTERSEERGTMDAKQMQLIQTGNFGKLESQADERRSIGRPLAEFQTSELPDMIVLKKLQNQLLDSSVFPPTYYDELKKLSAIIMFRVRNRQYELNIQL